MRSPWGLCPRFTQRPWGVPRAEDASPPPERIGAKAAYGSGNWRGGKQTPDRSLRIQVDQKLEARATMALSHLPTVEGVTEPSPRGRL